MSKPALIRFLLIIACMIGGALAGGDVYRYIIEVPAWRHLNVETWAKYSNYADLGNGIILFPVEAIGNALPLLIASFICLKGKGRKPGTSLLHISTGFALIGLVLTFFAAPIMLNLPKKEGNNNFIQEAFTKFHFWGGLRAVAQILSFVFSVLALANTGKANELSEKSVHFE